MGCRTGLRLAFYLGCGLTLGTIIPYGACEAALVLGAIERPMPPPQYGVASWYGFSEQGKPTASGKPFDARKLTAAHPTLPLDSKAKVTNLENGKSVEVTITDRGPAVAGRAIDLSKRAAEKLGMTKKGLAPVKIQPLPPPGSELASE